MESTFVLSMLMRKVCLFSVHISQEDGKHVIHDYVM